MQAVWFLLFWCFRVRVAYPSPEKMLHIFQNFAKFHEISREFATPAENPRQIDTIQSSVRWRFDSAAFVSRSDQLVRDDRRKRLTRHSAARRVGRWKSPLAPPCGGPGGCISAVKHDRGCHVSSSYLMIPGRIPRSASDRDWKRENERSVTRSQEQ